MKLLVLGVVFASVFSAFPSVESCETDWTLFNDNCYRYYSISDADWTEAEDTCEDAGGYLTAIHSEAEQEFVYNLWVSSRENNPSGVISTRDVAAIYIGLIDPGSNGIFEWMDDTPVDYTNWTPNQPSLGSQTVVVMWDWPTKEGTWNDISENVKLGSFMCEITKEVQEENEEDEEEDNAGNTNNSNNSSRRRRRGRRNRRRRNRRRH